MSGAVLTFDVMIVGAGASGLFCAFHVAQQGGRVLVVDHANKAGKKILMSGGGRCNFTNLNVRSEHFVSQNPHFVRSALSKFTPEHFLSYVKKHKISYHEKSHGQLFCDNTSKDVLNMLLDECQKHQVKIWLNTKILSITPDDDGFLVKTATPSKIFAKHLVVATGGLSIPTLGASGFGYQVATQFGHGIVPTQASLVPFTFSDKTGEMIKSLSGVSIDVAVFNDKIRFELPMLFTHRGLSGPAMLQMSNYWQLGESFCVDLSPSTDLNDVLLSHKNTHPKQKIRTVLAPYFPKKLLTALEGYFWCAIKDIELANIKDKELTQIVHHLHHWHLKPSGTEGYRVAEVTRGGVDTKEICGQTFESRRQSGLYFIGEVLDVTGQLGGYNFQWAWASGHACAMAIVKKLLE
ncbi:MAG: NAD(P)/FAD-dependent oxidoreductase [Moraxella sp.]|nr:NAD(P)/FAD-dependent oxidoreductase [Moraxella sp.]